MELTQQLLKELFEYKDGYLFWKKHRSIPLGAKAGYLRINKEGNRYKICVGYKSYYASRLIFLYHHGYLPIIVDHKDRDTTNNNIENLRAATHLQNQCNKRAKNGSTSQYLGVHFKDKKWQSKIKINGKTVYLGSFECERQAAIAYNKSAIINHGEFANLNIV